MSWNIENSELQKPHELCPEETLSHLAEHYPHLQASTESLEGWVRAALRDDADLIGLVLPYLGTREELLTYYWGSRRLVRESYDELNASLEDDWDALEDFRPLFPEYQDDVTRLAA